VLFLKFSLNTRILYEQKELIKRCIAGERKAYEQLYEQYGRKMLVVCNRYVQERSEAQDLLQEGFIKVFKHLSSFKNEGSFEGWIQKIMVNVALQHYQKSIKAYNHVSIGELSIEMQLSNDEDILGQIHAEVLLKLIQELPPSYKMVFNLYVFEGLKHREIAERLGISEGTSKSNLNDARKILQYKITLLNQEAKPQRSK
jgi:RNA polymerase sigma-70 factor (ECF subfamily)